ncbi:MAG: type II toxin-antitoxin system PemK/MazF family toxin [Isosphaeraceae bacterium]
MASPKALRGEVWQVDLNPVIGHEQGGRWPALIVSADGFNKSRAGLVMVVPLTSVAKGIRTHVPIHPPEGGLNLPSFAKCEDLRSASVERLAKRGGQASEETMRKIEDLLRLLLNL